MILILWTETLIAEPVT